MDNSQDKICPICGKSTDGLLNFTEHSIESRGMEGKNWVRRASGCDDRILESFSFTIGNFMGDLMPRRKMFFTKEQVEFWEKVEKDIGHDFNHI